MVPVPGSWQQCWQPALKHMLSSRQCWRRFVPYNSRFPDLPEISHTRPMCRATPVVSCVLKPAHVRSERPQPMAPAALSCSQLLVHLGSVRWGSSLDITVGPPQPGSNLTPAPCHVSCNKTFAGPLMGRTSLALAGEWKGDIVRCRRCCRVYCASSLPLRHAACLATTPASRPAVFSTGCLCPAG